MSVKGITLKVARKKKGSLPRARVRRAVAAAYGNSGIAQPVLVPAKVLVTFPDKRPLPAK